MQIKSNQERSVASPIQYWIYYIFMVYNVIQFIECRYTESNGILQGKALNAFPWRRLTAILIIDENRRKVMDWSESYLRDRRCNNKFRCLAFRKAAFWDLFCSIFIQANCNICCNHMESPVIFMLTIHNFISK